MSVRFRKVEPRIIPAPFQEDSGGVRRRICLFCGIERWLSLLDLEYHWTRQCKGNPKNG